MKKPLPPETMMFPKWLCRLLSATVILLMLGSYSVVLAQTTTPRPKTKMIHGTVVDENNKPMPGVTITPYPKIVGGTSSNENGSFSIMIASDVDSLRFSFIGYQVLVVNVKTSSLVKMQPVPEEIEKVVITGIFNRKAESYTGSAVTITAKDLIRSSNQNIFQALKNIDPSLYIMDNMLAGSNPNSLPGMQIRGTSSFPYDNAVNGINMKGNYQSIPNQPLFILDGFITSVERIFDLDMNRVENIVILKDASAKAIYGAKAANGVVVIETKRLAGNEQRITYNGSLDITMPDLSSYDLCSAAEKLEVERLSGMYEGSIIEHTMSLKEQYNATHKRIADGLDTYWLSKPLRVGIGQRHNINIELGDSRNLRSVLDFTYNNISGVMKGSDRTNISGSVNLSYRYKKLLFRNITTITSNKSKASPWGTFGSYSQMNPYWRAYDPETGQITRWATEKAIMFQKPIANPMYDATIGTLFAESYLDFLNNFYVEYQITDALKVMGRFGISSKRSDGDEFRPSNHSSFSTNQIVIGGLDGISLTPDRGSYRLDSGKSSDLSGDLNLAYNKTWGKHFVFANAGMSLSESSYSTYAHFAEGFPSNQGADITFARGYAQDKRPTGTSAISREFSILGSVNYSYDNRFLADLTYRLSASSKFGKDNRWAPGWSVGVGWNIHNESFLKGSDVVENLKLRASVGITGNQNFDTNYAIGTYKYYTDDIYMGLIGSYIENLPNPLLTWEQRKDYNIGLDATIKGVSLRVDYYDAYTENMLTTVSVSGTTGFKTVKDNLGLVRNQGVELNLNYNVWQGKNGFFNISGTITSERNIIQKLSESMRTFNAAQDKAAAYRGNNKPVLKYNDGESMNTIWAVPSLGIDPMTGLEVYVKKDGTRTFEYSALDLVAAGDGSPKFRGIFGLSGEWKGFGLSTSFRFLGGGQMYNETLVDRIENVDLDYNVDRRVFLGRWREPGQNAQFKTLGMFSTSEDIMSRPEKTRATTRFVQDRNDLVWGSLNAYYEFRHSFVKKIGLERLKVSFYMNDIATWSTIKVERGLDYPFARTMSLALTGTF